MHIAICDDDKDCLYQLEEYLSKIKSNCMSLSWDTYVDAESFLKDYGTEKRNFDVLITDIEMGSMSGIELASKIRENNDDIIIFFLTSYTEYAIQCFRPNPLNFWTKPMSFDEVKEDIERADKILNKALRYLTIIERRGVIDINVKDILYLEKVDRKTIIYMTDGRTHETNKSITKIYMDLPDDEFIIPYQSYIVNLAYVGKVTTKEIELRGGRKYFPISRTYVNEVRKKFVKFKERKVLADEYIYNS